MQEEIKENRYKEKLDAVLQERKAQAQAVCEAAYNRIKKAVNGNMSFEDKKGGNESDRRTDPITRFRQGVEQSGGVNLMGMGDLAERDPFYLLKSKNNSQK